MFNGGRTDLHSSLGEELVVRNKPCNSVRAEQRQPVIYDRALLRRSERSASFHKKRLQALDRP